MNWRKILGVDEKSETAKTGDYGDRIDGITPETPKKAILSPLSPDFAKPELEKQLPEPVDNTPELAPKIEAAVLAWLARIGETNPDLIRHTLDVCHRNPSTLTWILSQKGVR